MLCINSYPFQILSFCRLDCFTMIPVLQISDLISQRICTCYPTFISIRFDRRMNGIRSMVLALAIIDNLHLCHLDIFIPHPQRQYGICVTAPCPYRGLSFKFCNKCLMYSTIFALFTISPSSVSPNPSCLIVTFPFPNSSSPTKMPTSASLFSANLNCFDK